MLPPLRQQNNYNESHCRLSQFFDKDASLKTDFDIYLPKYSLNLQRDYCWNDLQKQELINSMLLLRHIPPITFVQYSSNYVQKDLWDKNMTDNEFFKFKYQVIDGKQRLITHKKFLDNEFHITIDGAKYFFNDLPNAYKSRLIHYEYKSIIIKYHHFGDASDDDLVELFKWCNFAGTQQEKDYLDKFK